MRRRGNVFIFVEYFLGIIILVLTWVSINILFAKGLILGRSIVTGSSYQIFFDLLEWFILFFVNIVFFVSTAWAINESRYDQELRGAG
jgi:hypothetical protein